MSTSHIESAPSITAAPPSPVWKTAVSAVLVACTVGLLCGLTLFDLYRFHWRPEPASQGPIAAAMVLYLFWHKSRRPEIKALLRNAEGHLGWGLAWLIPGLLVYAIGRSQSVMVLEVVGLVPSLVGVSIAVFGIKAVRLMWFCFVFILFVVPLPGVLADTITQPLKIVVSWASEHLFALLGYPVARQGVILQLGQYQLLVADACAGLSSLFVLEALGLLYLNVVRHESPMRNALMAIFIVPVAFVANTLRVMVLGLITFHFGDAAGQGFAHDFSGIVLFLLALSLIIAADGFSRRASWVFNR